jgi:hypothetical protein
LQISKNQSLEEIEKVWSCIIVAVITRKKEANEVMEACDKDKSGQISYAEFFTAQKKHNFSPSVQAAMAKITNFLQLHENERHQVMLDNHENFKRLLQEKEEVPPTPCTLLSSYFLFPAGHPSAARTARIGTFSLIKKT